MTKIISAVVLMLFATISVAQGLVQQQAPGFDSSTLTMRDAGPCYVGGGPPCNPPEPGPLFARPMVKYQNPQLDDVVSIWSDGTIQFDFGGSIAWSRYFVGEGWNIPGGKDVLVLTWVNGPNGRRPLFLRGIMPPEGKP